MLFLHPRLNLTLLTVLFALFLSESVEAGVDPGTTACLQIDEQQLTGDLRQLSSDAFAGRKPGTPGHAKATDYLINRFTELGLLSFNNDFVHSFSFDGDKQGKNVVGYLRGEQAAERYLVITAHYDHLGSQGSRIFNGADDNASGVATLLALAAHFRQFPSRHSLLFVATDAEESGLHGAHALLSELPVAQRSVTLNINIDMVGQGGYSDELFLVHDGKHPVLASLLREIRDRTALKNAKLTLRNARSRLARLTRNKRIDWRNASDYAAFAKYGIPFVHIGTDTHQDYHTPADALTNIDRPFFTTSAGVARCVVEAFDTLSRDTLDSPD